MLCWASTCTLMSRCTICTTLAARAKCTYNSICLRRKELCCDPILWWKKIALKMKPHPCTWLSVSHAAGSYRFQVSCEDWKLQQGALPHLSPGRPVRFYCNYLESLGFQEIIKKLCTLSKRSETIYILSFLVFEKSIYQCFSQIQETTVVCAYSIHIRK